MYTLTATITGKSLKEINFQLKSITTLINQGETFADHLVTHEKGFRMELTGEDIPEFETQEI